MRFIVLKEVVSTNEQSLSTITIRACSSVHHTMHGNIKVIGLACKMNPHVMPNYNYFVVRSQTSSWTGTTWLYCRPTCNYQHYKFFDQIES